MVAPSPTKSRPPVNHSILKNNVRDNRESDHPSPLVDHHHRVAASAAVVSSSGLYASNASSPLGSGSLCFSGAQLALANGTYNQYILQLAAAGAASSGYGPLLSGGECGSVYGDYASSVLSPAAYSWFKNAAYDSSRGAYDSSRGAGSAARDGQHMPGGNNGASSLMTSSGGGGGLLTIGPMQRRLAEQQQLHLLKQFQLKQQQ